MFRSHKDHRQVCTLLHVNCHTVDTLVMRYILNSFSESDYYITTDGQSASLSWNKVPIWGLRPDFYYCQTVADWLMWGALSDKRTGLSFITVSGPPRAVIFGSESRGTRGHILLSQIRDLPFRRLLRLGGLRWRHSNPPPRGINSFSITCTKLFILWHDAWKPEWYSVRRSLTKQHTRYCLNCWRHIHDDDLLKHRHHGYVKWNPWRLYTCIKILLSIYPSLPLFSLWLLSVVDFIRQLFQIPTSHLHYLISTVCRTKHLDE
jgi:hypothetical protein